jgi:hypothetical protein
LTYDGWFSDLQTQHQELLGETRLLSGLPKLWRDLFAEWVREVEQAGAIEAGMRVDTVSDKYGSLRAELVGRSSDDPRWDALEVDLEDRSMAALKRTGIDG